MAQVNLVKAGASPRVDLAKSPKSPKSPGASTGPARAVPRPGPPSAAARARAARSPAAVAFDLLYLRTARRLIRQLYLLTGDRQLAHESVEHGFHEAWLRWSEVAVDPEPEGWIRAAACEYVLSPWQRFLRRHRGRLGWLGWLPLWGGQPAPGPGDSLPAAPRIRDRPLFGALQGLTGRQRHAVLLYDAVGLGLPETAAEVQATTPTAAARLTSAHDQLAGTVPELAGTDPHRPEFTRRLARLLREAATAHEIRPLPPARVRAEGEHRAKRLAQGTAALAGILVLWMLISIGVGYLLAEPRQAGPRPVTHREPAGGPPWQAPGQAAGAGKAEVGTAKVTPRIPQRLWTGTPRPGQPDAAAAPAERTPRKAAEGARLHPLPR